MALNDTAVLTAAKGYVFTAPVGTAAPTPAEIESFDPATGFTEWESVGHTSIDDLPEFGFDGGDTETKGTWQNATLREVVTEAASDFVTINVLQFDDTNLGLYYGQETPDTSQAAGVYAITDAPSKTVTKALLVVIVDGDVAIGFHAPKASVRRDDSISMATDDFAALPLRFTFVKDDTAAYLFAWISSDTGLNSGGTGA